MRFHPQIVNTGANILLLLASATLGTTLWYKYAHGRQAASAPKAFPFRVGDRAPAIPGIDYARAEQSLVGAC